MTEEDFKRKLTAILSADVEGYSRLMGEDEDATIRTLTAYRELMTTLIHKHRGRVVDSPGDNLLAEFGSVVDAVRCAVEIQEELRVRNAELPENRRMEFRIGINLGDVVEEGDRIYGDGVNITARVEGLAEGGGICISGTVYDSIKNKLSLSYESLGEHTVKNITEPVRVYRMRVEPEAPVKPKPRRWQKAALAAVVVLLVAAGAWAIWNFYLRPPPIEPVSVEKMAYPLPEKPSIAVLPFVNMSGDPEQEYFSDGITEEIITALSKTPKLFVVARTSSFKYKGKEVDVRTVGRELGVRYVLEGSVRKAGDRVRITAQLVDSQTGHHLWAERYDRNLKDILALQIEITKEVTQAMQVKLTEGEQARMWTKASPEVRELVWKGREYIQRFNKDGNTLAKRAAKEMIHLDPQFAGGYELLAWTHIFDINFAWSNNPKESLDKAFKFTKISLALDNSIANTHSLMAYLHLMRHQYDEAVEEAERAVSLNPNAADCMATFGLILRWVGHPEKAVEHLKKAIRLNPKPLNYYFVGLGNAYRDMDLYDQALIEFKRVIARNPNDLTARLGLASTYALAGRQDEARAEAEEVLRIHPKFSLGRYERGVHYKKREDGERYLEALRKAGLK
jgi:adenylate cyclase